MIILLRRATAANRRFRRAELRSFSASYPTKPLDKFIGLWGGPLGANQPGGNASTSRTTERPTPPTGSSQVSPASSTAGGLPLPPPPPMDFATSSTTTTSIPLPSIPRDRENGRSDPEGPPTTSEPRDPDPRGKAHVKPSAEYFRHPGASHSYPVHQGRGHCRGMFSGRQAMAFANKIGGLFKKAVQSNPSIFQVVRCMSSSKLFIGGLSFNTDDHGLREAFSGYGEVVDAKVITDRDSGRSRGFGFITFASGEEASAAMTALDGKGGQSNDDFKDDSDDGDNYANKRT
ncbi:hypothetical protein KSP40_PGU012058 [Platanthera guangdongensis]|uniref:RRM domain-containing protein n=1 Tax=Platanthera guangdongensis TaxID=2320717 RepID=A0ABR2LEH6_9ASPA